MEIKVSSFTDESGQDTKWKNFLVCTVICLSNDQNDLENKLENIEKISGKNYKWHKSNYLRRRKYIDQILYEKIYKKFQIYYSRYQNKSEYIDLVSSHIAKSINTYNHNTEYEAKIFIDKIDKKTLDGIKKEIKLFKIKFKKIRGLTDESNSLIRLADSACGLIRDLDLKKAPKCYQKFYSLIHKI